MISAEGFVHGNERARAELLHSTYPREWFDPLMADRYLRRGAYVIEQGTFDWETYLGPRYIPSGPPSSIPNAWQREDELFVPFRHSDGHILGLFSVGDPVSGRRLSNEELDVLVAVTLQAAVLVEAAQTNAAWERSQNGLAELLAVSGRLLEPGSVQDVLDRVCAGVRSALGFDKVQIQLHDPVTATYRCSASLGWPDGDRAVTTSTTDADLARLLDPEFEVDGCYLLSHDAGAARCSQASIGYLSQYNGAGPNAWNRHWLAVPMHDRDGHVIGTIWADDPHDRLLPSTEILQALRVFANQATAALDSAGRFEEMRFLAEHDPLTRLYNRRAFNDRLRVEATRARRYGTPFALVVLDVNGFKRINDRHGHLAGDAALARVADLLNNQLRAPDAAFRIGGDEFALVLTEIELGEVTPVVRRIAAHLADVSTAEGHAVSASFGVAVFGGTIKDEETLLRSADAAMYAAKRSGEDVHLAA